MAVSTVLAYVIGLASLISWIIAMLGLCVDPMQTRKIVQLDLRLYYSVGRFLLNALLNNPGFDIRWLTRMGSDPTG